MSNQTNLTKEQALDPSNEEIILEAAKEINLRKAVEAAKDENTPSEKLAELSKSEDWQVRMGVAANGNTPRQAKQLMAGKEENQDVLKALVKDEDENMQFLVSGNRNTSPELLGEIASKLDWGVREYEDIWTTPQMEIVTNENTPKEVLNDLVFNQNTMDKDLKRRIASNPNTPTEALEELWKYTKDNDLDTSQNEELSESEKKLLRGWIAENKNTPTSLLDVLAKNEDESVRRYVFENESTPFQTKIEIVENETNPDVLEAFAEDIDGDIRQVVVWNKNTPFLTKIEMAQNDADPDVLRSLSEEEDEKIRYDVVWNENTSSELKIEMAQSEESPAVLKALAENGDLETHTALMSNVNTRSEVLECIYENDHDSLLDLALVGHPNTPIEISTDILRNTDNTTIFETIDRFNYSWEERVALIENNNLDGYKRLEMTREEEDPRAILALANSEVEGVRMHSAENPLMPQEILAEMAQEDEDTRDSVAWNQNTSSETLKELAKDESESIREGVALNRNTSNETLIELSKDKSHIVRYSVVQNENVPTEALSELLKDEDSDIRNQASENLASRSKEQTKETKNKYAAKYQKTSEALDERGASTGLGE